MEKEYFKPGMDELKPYFGPESGINTPRRLPSCWACFTEVAAGAGRKGVNVSANALSWLKRLTLQGKIYRSSTQRSRKSCWPMKPKK